MSSSFTFGSIIGILNLIVMTVLLVGGAALMVSRRQEHGRAAVMGIVGCVVLLLGVGVSAFLVFGFPALVGTLGPMRIQTVLAVINIVTMLIQATGTGLLIFAVIARRNPQQPVGGGWQPQPGPGQQWQQGPQQPPYQQQPPGWQQPPQPPFGGPQG
ncbi:hypothetical protein AB0I81_37400 [Nonomuraea sp. NPDC050404]|uniref:hypothetical protein n=1 Tax=Nonomuraea sp. NPDC050404 TaxID=3155783 RepID=UPI00340085EF